jgi:flagellar hook-associated protein 3 FlgL
MRITSTMINSQLAGDLQAAVAAMAKQQRIISSGRRINEPADDPGGTANALAVRSRQAANEQFLKNVQTARNNLGASDGSVRSVIDYIEQAKEAALQGANDSNDALSRQALGSQVDQILEGLVSVGNQRGPGGAMLFGGQEVTTAPYTVTRDVNGKITAVASNPRGITAQMPAEVAEGVTIAQGVSGDTVFGAIADPTNVFSTLIRLRDALNINDANAVRTELNTLDADHDRANLASIVVGTRLGWLDTLESRLQNESLSLATTLSGIEDADMAKAITDLNQIQTFYNGGLAAGAKLLTQSLADFLR